MPLLPGLTPFLLGWILDRILMQSTLPLLLLSLALLMAAVSLLGCRSKQPKKTS